MKVAPAPNWPSLIRVSPPQLVRKRARRWEKAAWIEIERSAKEGRQANLILDDLVPGLPTARAVTAPDALVKLNKDEPAGIAKNDNPQTLNPATAPPASVSSSEDSGMTNSTSEDSANIRVISAVANGTSHTQAASLSSTSTAASNDRSTFYRTFREWTAVCSYDDMRDIRLCSIQSESKRVAQGRISGHIKLLLQVPGSFDLFGTVIGGWASSLQPMAKVDQNQAEYAVGDPGETVDPDTSGIRYIYMLSEETNQQAMSGRRIRIRVSTNGGDLETTFNLAGFSRANAALSKWLSLHP
jgi:hypothetical protein